MEKFNFKKTQEIDFRSSYTIKLIMFASINRKHEFNV